MDHQSSQDPGFLKTVESWLSETGEVLVEIRYSHAVGNRDWEFFASFSQFAERISQCDPRTLVTVFRKPQLPLRGIVDEDFISKAMSIVPDGKEYLAAGLDKVQYGKRSCLHYDAGTSHGEMKEDLGEVKGTRVAFGPHPAFRSDSEDFAWAIVPMPDGRVECGVY